MKTKEETLDKIINSIDWAKYYDMELRFFEAGLSRYKTEGPNHLKAEVINALRMMMFDQEFADETYLDFGNFVIQRESDEEGDLYYLIFGVSQTGYYDKRK